MTQYVFFNELTVPQVEQVNNIFFDNSEVKSFKDEEAKKKFHQKYLGIYQDKHADHFICAVDNENVIGYICGAIDSKNEKELFVCLSHYNVFEDLYDSYPAHLHINVSLKFSSKGLGSKLINFYEKHLIGFNIQGVHLITNPGARNVNFYQKNLYSFSCEREFKGHPLLFLGKTLSH